MTDFTSDARPSNAMTEAVRASIAREIRYPALSDELRERLNDYFAPSIEELEEISGQSLSHWHGSLTPAE